MLKDKTIKFLVDAGLFAFIIIANMASFTRPSIANSGALLLPRSITGDWHPTSYACSSPQSEANGVYIDTTGSVDTRNGYRSCQIQYWDTISTGGRSSVLGQWAFTANCTSAQLKGGNGSASGTITLKEMGEPSESVLFIDWRFKQTELVDPLSNIELGITQRCNGPRPATHYGWAMPSKK